MKQTHWTDSPFVAFDTETTGTDPQTARIIEAALVTDDPDGILKEDARVLYINPGIPIPPEASAIHGITEQVLIEKNAGGPQSSITFIFWSINSRATRREYPLVIFNASYDWPLLMAECARIPGFSYEDQAWPHFLDPLVIDRALDRYRKGSRKLEDVARFYKVALDGAHGAQADATATLGVMRAIIKAYPELKKHSLAEMQTLQARWYLEWRDHMNSYWTSIGKADRITGEWPQRQVQFAVAKGAV